MTHAYNEMYLDDAMECPGAAVEYATIICGIDGDLLFYMYFAGGIAEAFGRGDVTCLSGMSGIELARRVMKLCGMAGSPVTELPTWITRQNTGWAGFWPGVSVKGGCPLPPFSGT